MNTGFPTAPRSGRTGDAGLNRVATVVNDDWGWIFRRTHEEHDFGIDGYLDVVSDHGGVTGRCIAVQVKSGQSYFAQQDAVSVTYYGENKHLNYYLNSPMPVLIILHDPTTGSCIWAQFLPELTEKTQTGWKLSIPKRNVFDESAKPIVAAIVGEPEDYSERLESHWATGEALAESDYVLYIVGRELVEAGDTAAVVSFFHRLRSSEDLARKYQGRVDLGISGYDDDPRELWEISEVREWFRIADAGVGDWFYFLEARPSHSPLRAYVSCMCDTRWLDDSDERFPAARVEVDGPQMAKLFEVNFLRLNQLLDELDMTIDDNKTICYRIYDVFGVPHEPWPV